MSAPDPERTLDLSRKMKGGPFRRSQIPNAIDQFPHDPPFSKFL
jgi:hypothetical protein